MMAGVSIATSLDRVSYTAGDNAVRILLIDIQSFVEGMDGPRYTDSNVVVI